MIARYAAHDATSEGRVVLDLVRIGKFRLNFFGSPVDLPAAEH